MENSSKALIMAASVLIAVAIVGLGIYIFTTSNLITDTTVGQVNALEVSTINSKFELYQKDKVKGSAIKQLVKDVNALNFESFLPVFISISGTNHITSSGTGTSTRYDLVGAFRDNANYSVRLKYDSSSGYVNEIIVTYVSN